MNRWALFCLNVAVRWSEWWDRRTLFGDGLIDALRTLTGTSAPRPS